MKLIESTLFELVLHFVLVFAAVDMPDILLLTKDMILVIGTPSKVHLSSTSFKNYS